MARAARLFGFFNYSIGSRFDFSRDLAGSGIQSRVITDTSSEFLTLLKTFIIYILCSRLPAGQASHVLRFFLNFMRLS
jgi:hypothetical protein